jgi:hypothetical protein
MVVVLRTAPQPGSASRRIASADSLEHGANDAAAK